jgi:hypothetical protein
MQHLVHFLGGQEEVDAALLRHQETESIWMADDAATDEVGLVRDQPVTAPVLH